MNTDIVDLREFYHSPLGRSAEQAITMALSTLWPPLPEERLVGLGYAVPFLDRFRHDTERTFAFMPAGQGAVNWPAGELSSTALVFDEELPLPDSSIDRVLMVHALEFAENPRETLKELWRGLAPGGRLAVDRGAEPARRLGAHGTYALRLRATLFARPVDRTSARNQFHAGCLRRGIVLPTHHKPPGAEIPPLPRTYRPQAVAPVFRCHCGGGAKTSLSGIARHPARLTPGVCAGSRSTGRSHHPHRRKARKAALTLDKTPIPV